MEVERIATRMLDRWRPGWGHAPAPESPLVNTPDFGRLAGDFQRQVTLKTSSTDLRQHV